MQVHIKLACNRHAASFEWVLELPVTAFDAPQPPAIGLDQFDSIPNSHLFLRVCQSRCKYSSSWMSIVHTNHGMLERHITLEEMAAKYQACSWRRRAGCIVERMPRGGSAAGGDGADGEALEDWGVSRLQPGLTTSQRQSIREIISLRLPL